MENETIATVPITEDAMDTPTTPAAEVSSRSITPLYNVLDVVVGVGGAVASGVSHNVGGAVASVSSGVFSAVSEVSEGVGSTVQQVSHAMMRCLTLPPHATPPTPPTDAGDVIATPRTTSRDSGLGSLARNRADSESCSEEEEEDQESQRGEELSICRELGVGDHTLQGDQCDVLHRLVSLEGRVRALLLDSPAGTIRRRGLVNTLVALRQHSQKVLELSSLANSVGGVSVRGHLLMRGRGLGNSCDVCTHTIWDLVATAYNCTACRLHVHWSCTDHMRRPCPASFFSHNAVTSRISSNSTNASPMRDPLRIRSASSVFYDTQTSYKKTSSNPTSLLKDGTRKRRKSMKSADKRNLENTASTSNISVPSTGDVIKASACIISTSLPSDSTEYITTAVSTVSNSGHSGSRSTNSSPVKQTRPYINGRHRVAIWKNLYGFESLETLALNATVCTGGLASALPTSSLISLITRICPEVGLGAQDFQCAECKQAITNRFSMPTMEVSNLRGDSAWSEPRLCHYTGLYFCPACHWNNMATLPALLVSNWDLVERPVSRCAYQLLHYCRRLPLLDLHSLNPHLFILMQELCEVKKLREDLLLMKQYLCSCRVAVESKLLLLLSDRQHFVDSASLYSIQDLLDVQSGVLLKELHNVHDTYAQHITKDCLLCKNRGHICLNCREDGDVLYPFDQRAVQCSVCYAVIHIECYNMRRTCAKCVRQGRLAEVTIIGAMGEMSTPVIGATSSALRKSSIPTVVKYSDVTDNSIGSSSQQKSRSTSGGGANMSSRVTNLPTLQNESKLRYEDNNSPEKNLKSVSDISKIAVNPFDED